MADSSGGLRIELLGPVEAWVDGQPVALGGQRPRALFAVLALMGGRVVAARGRRSERLLRTTSGGADVEAAATTSSYRELIDRLKGRIRESQARAARALNTELGMLYWSIGRDILAEQQAGGWGDDIVGRIAEDLRVATGSARGFSRRNLFYMRRFAALWPEAERAPSVMAQISWTAHRTLLDAWAEQRDLYLW